MNGVWHNAKEEIPPEGQVVLAVKQLRNGTRDVCLAHCLHDYKYLDYVTKQFHTGPYWCCGGNNNIIWWTELPEIPEKGGT